MGRISIGIYENSTRTDFEMTVHLFEIYVNLASNIFPCSDAVFLLTFPRYMICQSECKFGFLCGVSARVDSHLMK